MRDLKTTRTSDVPSFWMRARVLLMGAFFVACLVAVWARAFSLQVLEKDKLRTMAQDQYVRHVEIPARRGDIFDRRGVPLAQSVEVDSVWVDPSMLPNLPKAARAMAKATGVDAAELEARMSRAKRFAWVKRQASSNQVDKVKALGLPGVGFSKEPRRFYPQRELSAHLLGMVGSDGRGLDGLEHAFDAELSGQGARLSGFRDARGRKLFTNGLGTFESQHGASLTLTIDRQLQYVAEKALARAVDDARAVAGMVVVLNPRTGEVLALANYPRFNPNALDKVQVQHTRNRAVLDAFEPGSTMKPFVVAAALQEKKVRPAQTFFCENGKWAVGKHLIGDSHPHRLLTPEKILTVSSNIGVAKIAQVLGRDKLVEFYGRFGFGERVGLGLSGEGKGVIPYPKADISLVTQSFGQGMTVTALQLAVAYGALANGGVLMRPYVVSKVEAPDGVVLLENQPLAVRQAVSSEVAGSLLSMLEGVVGPEGTAPRARMDEYRVAGKTGTAQKADPVAGGYSEKRIASFVGVLPVESPKAVIALVIDEPQTDVYGGVVAAPAFKELAQVAMAYLGVAPSRTLPVPTLDPERRPSLSKSMDVGPPTREVKPDVIQPLTDTALQGSVRVPDVSGEVARFAVSRLLSVALEPRLAGSGRVVAQSPAPGTVVAKGTQVTLELAGEGTPYLTK